MEDNTLVKRVLPHNIEAEQSVIGCMLYSEDVLGQVIGILHPEDFYQHSYGVMYETILELQREGRNVDLITLQNALKEKDIAPEVYAMENLKDLVNAVFTVANVKEYAKIVADKAQMRRMIRSFERMTEAYYQEKESPEKLMSDTEKEIFDLLEKRTESKYEDIRDISIRALNLIEEASKTQGGITGLETGFTRLDAITSGLQKSELIILAARPAMGKTAFALNLADYFAVKKGYRTAIFELEMGREQLVTRLFAMESGVNSTKLRTGQLSDREWDDLVSASTRIANSKLIIDDTSGITLAELRSRCRRYKLEFGLDCVIIDYMQLMAGNSKSSGDNRQQEISEISRGLKGLARELEVPVLALSQLSRKPEDRKDHRPMLSDLRESGSIEQDADIVMFLYRDEVYFSDTPDKGKAELIIAKHRKGEIGTVDLAWVSDLTKFSNLEYDPERKYQT